MLNIELIKNSLPTVKVIKVVMKVERLKIPTCSNKQKYIPNMPIQKICHDFTNFSHDSVSRCVKAGVLLHTLWLVVAIDMLHLKLDERRSKV